MNSTGRSSDFCIGCDDFFCGLTFDFFLICSFPLLKESQTVLSSSESVKLTRNVVDF